MVNQFQKEQNDLLKFILKDLFCAKFKQFKNNRNSKKGIELYITSVCNQKCEYCYLVKYGDELYPKEIRNKTQILHNLHLFFDYCLEEGIDYIPNLDLFSGEIWGMEFGNQILDIILEYLKKGLKIAEIMIPSNCSWMTDSRIAAVIDSYQKRFDEYDCIFRISASIDGYPIEAKSRPFKKAIDLTTELKTEQYYDNLMQFFFNHNWGFHPMLSAESIEYQKENYKWWHDQFIKCGHSSVQDWYNYIMFLEVRNDSWTNEKIIAFLDWLNFALDYDFKLYWNNLPIEFCNDILLSQHSSPIYYLDGSIYNKTINLENMTFSYLPSTISVDNIQYSCSVGTLLTVRLGDLTISPCHRTSYPKFNYGKFAVKDDKIVDIEANNPFLAFNILAQGKITQFKCDTCVLNKYCIKGCLGAQYETSHDMFYPIESVCELLFAKYIFMYKKVHKFIKQYKLDETFKISTKIYDDLILNIKENNEEVYNKWNTIIETLI